MKKLFSGILAACMAIGVCSVASGCDDNLKNGSKIETCAITFDVNGTEEVINFELYMNIAPATIAHFKYLANNNYYDNSAVSDVNNYIEFGAFASDWTSLDAKYNGIINADYVKTLKESDYTSKFSINGEFSANGYTYEGTNLDLSEGALVLKRDLKAIDGEEYIEKYDTAKGVMAITYGTSSYFDSANSFAILGKVVKDDSTSDVKSSYDRLKTILTDYKKDDGDLKYYYISYNPDDEDENKTKIEAAFEKYGRAYMVDDDGDTFVKDANGNFTVKLHKEDEDGETYLNAIQNNSVYVALRPAKTITVKSVTFAK